MVYQQSGRTTEVRIGHPSEAGGSIPTKMLQFATPKEAAEWVEKFNSVTGHTDRYKGLCASVHEGPQIPDPVEYANELLTSYQDHLAA